MSAQGKFADDGAALQDFFVEFLVFLGIANVDAGAEDADGTAAYGHGALVADSIDAAGHAAGDDEASRGKIATESFRHLRAVESWAPGADNAEAGEIEDFRVPANVEQDRGVVDLQKRLRIF